MAQWTGVISFGLVNIAVTLEKAETSDDLNFKMIDRRDHSPVGYKLINKNTGLELDRGEVVKGYEYKEGRFVEVTDEDFRRANPKATQTIEIVTFVNQTDIDPRYFEKPYFVHAQKQSEKSYALLFETLKRSEKIGIAQVVISRKQHMAALMVNGPVLILELLRFAHELKAPKTENMRPKLNGAELKMAEQLVNAMAAPWNPHHYHDTYQDDLHKMIQKKIKAGKTGKLKLPEEPEEAMEPTSNVVDFMSLLKKSLRAAH